MSGGSSYRSRSPKRRSGKEGGKGGGGGEREGGREKETTAAVVSCELEWDSGSHAEQELIINGGVSPAKESPLTTAGKQIPSELASSSVDKMSGASAQGGSGEGGEEEGETGSQTSAGEKADQHEGKSEEKKIAPRLTYTRVSLTLHMHSLSFCMPPCVYCILLSPCVCPCCLYVHVLLCLWVCLFILCVSMCLCVCVSVCSLVLLCCSSL